MTNEERAQTALEHVKRFGKHNCPNEELDTQAADLVTNILHLIRRHAGVEALEMWLLDRLAMHDEELRDDPETDEE